MDKSEQKHRKKLNTQQLEVLELLYKFRFGSNDLIAQYFGKKDRSFVFKRLSILLDQRLIGKRFDSSYRIKGKPAAYYLLPAGARALQENRLDRPINIKAIYKDKTVSEDFVNYCFEVFSLYCQLKRTYGDSLKFIAKSQLANRYDYFEDFVPSVYVRLDVDGSEKHFFLEYLQNSKPFFTILRRLKQYIEYADSGEWEAGTNSDFPNVLLVCDSPSLQKRLLKKASSILEDADDELRLYLAIKSNLNEWYDLTEPDEKCVSQSALFE
ncbi:MAG TPA: replication-relaxation family protein [Candidatus Saccharimonadales bacterium]|nr:replication-relaxation family protein [Candidatus Saccharimonadales bacterium]